MKKPAAEPFSATWNFIFMKISKKCQYALRAVFELASKNRDEPVKTHDIASAQGISPRFAEVILNELKHGGFVESRRGNEGGYILARSSDDLTVREVIEYIQGPISIAQEGITNKGNAAYFGDEAFHELWRQVNNAIVEVFESKAFADLIIFERKKRNLRLPDYNI